MGQCEPNKPPSDVPEPNKPEPGKDEPNSLRAIHPEPNAAPSGTHEPNSIEPSRLEPNDVNIPITEPNSLKGDSAVAFHNRCADIFKNYVDHRGLVDYKTLRRKKLELKVALDEFDKLDPNVYRSWSKEDQIAFWINAYNIQILKVITDNYTIKPSSRFLSAWWGHNDIRHIDGIWTKHKFRIMDEVFTLSEVEKRFFRKEFDDPRVFFALSRASLSGPLLRNEPWYGLTLDKQLDDQVKRFLASPLAFRVDKERQKVYLSALFQISMYGNDFIPKYGIDRKFKEQVPSTRAVLNFVTRYVSEDVVSFLELGNYSVQFIAYDYTVNDGS